MFEKLCLEGFQSGLSWLTILRKRESFRPAFRGSDLDAVARFGARDVSRLLKDAAIVRHRGKIESTINNARRILALWDSGRTLNDLVWSFVDGQPVVNAWSALTQVPASTPVSQALSRTLKKAGFRFVGATTCYAFMQAAGLVIDHLVSCPARHAPLAAGACSRP